MMGTHSWVRVNGAWVLTTDEIQLFDLARAGPAGVSYLAAPVFSPAGTVALQLVASGMPTDLGLRDIETLAERLRAAAATITAEIHGRPPPS